LRNQTIAVRRLPSGPGRYFPVPVATKPPEIPQKDWDILARINDYVINHVDYDHARAARSDGGWQTPQETLERGLGVCRDYAVLFERVARRKGYEVYTVSSDQLNHAWNTVKIAGRWWMVDCTWNDFATFTNGGEVPRSIRRDPDFRKRYFLTTPAREKQLLAQGLITRSHIVSDAKRIDMEMTLRAAELVDAIKPLVQQCQQLNQRRNILVDQYNRVVAVFNAQRSREAQAPYRQKLDALQPVLDRLDKMLQARHAQIDKLYAEFRRIDAAHPIAITYTYTRK